MTYETLLKAAQTRNLDIFGAFHPEDEDLAPSGTKTLLLLGPHEPGFWPHVSAQSEFSDGLPDPLDRWSKRVVSDWARALGATPVYPSDGPPYPPFIRWALRSERAWSSPVAMLVHDRAGLFVSYRAAITLPQRIALPERNAANPCETCDTKPCVTACPVSAITEIQYDVPTCKTFLDTTEGKDCRFNGCGVRRACPISTTYGRLAEQSAFHMDAFHPQ